MSRCGLAAPGINHTTSEKTRTHLPVIVLKVCWWFCRCITVYHATLADIRDLISLDDVTEELKYGPNGGLLFCMQYLVENMDWLKDQIDEFASDDVYFIFDCPGQIELYTHIPVMKRIVNNLKLWGFNVCGVCTIDATFVVDVTKFLSGALMALSTMINLELPHVNVRIRF